MPRNNALFPGGPGSPRWRQSTPRCPAAPIWCPVGASLLLGPSGLYVHYIRTWRACQGVLQMTEVGPEPPLVISGASGPATLVATPAVASSSATGISGYEYRETTPPRRG